mmetsp:Transcript_1051/g.4339  ORF Transcript_1051/g.4339 Transcript_1051/m.4339 type:complete len:220 (+) Transcript_1051:719-1378(+)
MLQVDGGPRQPRAALEPALVLQKVAVEDAQGPSHNERLFVRAALAQLCRTPCRCIEVFDHQHEIIRIQADVARPQAMATWHPQGASCTIHLDILLLKEPVHLARELRVEPSFPLVPLLKHSDPMRRTPGCALDHKFRARAAARETSVKTTSMQDSHRAVDPLFNIVQALLLDLASLDQPNRRQVGAFEQPRHRQRIRRGCNRVVPHPSQSSPKPRATMV